MKSNGKEYDERKEHTVMQLCGEYHTYSNIERQLEQLETDDIQRMIDESK